MQDLVPFDDVAKINLIKQGLQVLCLFLVALFHHHEGQAAVSIILLPSAPFVALVGVVKLLKRQGIDPDLIAAPAKFGQNIRGQHFRVAARHIHVNIIVFHQAEDHVHKADLILRALNVGVLNGYDLLDLVEEHIIGLALICGHATNVFAQLQRIAVLDVFVIVQRKADDLLVLHTDGSQIALVDIEQQIGLSTPPDAGDDLH